MRIGCLAWGSLIWKWHPLRLATRWLDDGPRLPVEFARESDGGELATVLCPGAADLAVLWALLEETDLQSACGQLRTREKIPPDRVDGIGCTAPLAGVAQSPYKASIAEWAHRQQLDAVIWTALPARSKGIEGRLPSVDEAVLYLQGLSGATLAHAQEYVRRVPGRIDTHYRREIERRLGWTPDPTTG